MSCKSAIYTAMQNPTGVSVDGVIPLGSLIRRYGCDIAMNGNAINIPPKKGIQIPFRMPNHQMHVQSAAIVVCYLSNCFHSKGNVGDEISVLHVQMKAAGCSQAVNRRS